jgi:hypothetical protein
MHGSPRKAGGIKPLHGSPRKARGIKPLHGSLRKAGGPNPCTVPLAKRLTARQFLGELEVRQILPPSYRFPPRAGGTKQRFPLRSRGNLTEGVFKKCRAMSAKRGEPHGGG